MEDASVTERATLHETTPEHVTKRAKAVAHSATTDWSAIRLAWCNGATSPELALQYGVSEASVRSRAMRGKWVKGSQKLLKEGSERAVKRILSKQVAKMRPEVEARARAAIEECVSQSIATSQKLVTEVHGKLEGASLKDLSNGASALVGGVKVWREALGLGDSDSQARSVAINLHIGYAQAGEEIDPAIDV